MRTPKGFALLHTGILVLAVAAACGDSRRSQVSEGVERIGSTSSALLSSAWTATVTMSVARQNHVAALLKNGSVLVAGGHPGNNVPTSSAEVYSPATGAWTTVGSMGTARRLFGACALASGKVLVAGGNAGAGDVTSAELFDPSTNTWSATGSLAAAREDFSMTCLSDGRVLVAGGSGPSGLLSSAEVYSPTSGTWSSAGSMPAAVHTQGAVLLSDGRVLVAGGNNASGPVNTAAVWTPSTNAWTVTGSMATTRAFYALNMLSDGRVLAAGGLVNVFLTTTNTAEIYTPSTGTWSAAAPLNTARYSGVSATLAAGPIVVGGVNGGSPLATSESYDSVHNTWTQVATTYGAVNQTATALSPTSVIVAGGNTGSSATTSAQTYGLLNVFAVYAQRSVTLGSSDHINGGDVGVAAVASKEFFPQLVVGSSATVQTNHNLVAPSVSLGSGAQVGDVQTNSLTNSGGTLGRQAAYPPSMPAPPQALPAGPGGSNVSVPAATITTLNPGNYGAVSVTGTLDLNAGSYTFASVTMADQAHLAGVSGSATVSVAGTFQAGNSVSISSPGATPAGQLVISVAGSDSGSTPAFSIGTGAAMSAILSAPNGTLSIGASTVATGAFAGIDVKLGSGVTITYQNGFAGSATPPPPPVSVASVPPRTLPLPPKTQGCYQGTANGWVQIPCTPSSTPVPIQQEFDQITTPNGASATIPFQFGQVEATFTAFGTETNITPPTSTMTPTSFSVQGNTSFFNGNNNCTGGTCDTDWVQFVVATSGGQNSLQIQTWDISTERKTGLGPCASGCNIGCGCSNFGAGMGTPQSIPTRPSGITALDFASVAGSVYTDSSNNPVIGMVAQISWYDPSSDPLNNRGLYAIVAADQYGLGSNWQGFSGTVIGNGRSSQANFTNSSVLTRTLAGTCNNETIVPSANSIPWPGTCPGSSALLPNTTMVQASYTGESNNLCRVGSSTPLVAANTNLVFSQYLASTSCSPPSCVSTTSQVFVRSNDEDTGVRPINLNGIPFWESPDLFIVPSGEQVTVNSVSSEMLLTAGQQYDAWVRVHNDFGCNSVGGVQARIFLADPQALSTPWAAGEITGGSYATGTGQAAGGITVPAGQAAMLGPFTFTAPTSGFGNGHRCALADVIATGEGAPATPFDPTSSSQVAQRNLQFENCAYALTNSTTNSGNLQMTLSVTTPGSPPAAPVIPSLTSGGVNASVVFTDPNGTWAAVWSAQSGAGTAFSVTTSGSGGSATTTVQLGQATVNLNTVPLAAGGSQTATASITGLASGATADLSVQAVLKDATSGTQLVANGGSCQVVAPQAPPPPM